MMFLVLAVLVAMTAAATVWLAGTRPALENDADSAFWYTFVGLCVLAPMIFIPALSNNAASLTLLLLGAASAIATHAALRRHQAAVRAATALAALQAALTTTTATHQTLMDRWACYLLDPEPAAQFPAMTSLQSPETATLIRAMAAAAQLAPSAALTYDGVAAYQQAVASLGEALETAEEAAAKS